MSPACVPARLPCCLWCFPFLFRISIIFMFKFSFRVNYHLFVFRCILGQILCYLLISALYNNKVFIIYQLYIFVLCSVLICRGSFFLWRFHPFGCMGYICPGVFRMGYICPRSLVPAVLFLCPAVYSMPPGFFYIWVIMKQYSRSVLLPFVCFNLSHYLTLLFGAAAPCVFPFSISLIFTLYIYFFGLFSVL